MKICFIWTERFRNFRDFGLNLSSVEKFAYRNGVLEMESLTPLPDDFFGSTITEVTGIVGKNGAGKSNALELLFHAIKSGNDSLVKDFLVVTSELGQYVCHFSFASGGPPIVPPGFDVLKYDPGFCRAKAVFFSNVYDERKLSFHSDVSDISLNNFYRRPINSKLRTSSFTKQIRLTNSKVFRTLDIDLPEKVQLLSRLWSYRTTYRLDNLRSTTSLKMKEFSRSFRERARDISSINKFPILFKFGYFIEVYIFCHKHIDLLVSRSKFTTGLDDLFHRLSAIRSTEEIADRLIEYLDDTFSLDDFEISGTSSSMWRRESSGLKEFHEQIKFIQQLKSSIYDLHFEYFSEGSRSRNIEYFTFDYNSKKAKKFISDYTELFGDTELFDIDWLGISSGHKAYLNVFASLHQELKATRHEELVLCIDEGDLYLHPKWQVEFFDKLINALPNLYSGKVQLILTSHSPFLLSDLPRQNITILDPEIGGAAMNGVDLVSNTFGGNLYDLYAEFFFLGEKRTSDFAYKKIKKLIEMVEGGNLTKLEKNNLRRHINIFGDEIVQFRLNEQLKK